MSPKDKKDHEIKFCLYVGLLFESIGNGIFTVCASQFKIGKRYAGKVYRCSKAADRRQFFV